MNHARKLIDLVPEKGLESCIALSYSMEFNYLEQIFLAEISKKGVYNLVVLADREMVNQTMERQANALHHYGSKYCILPMSSRNGGAFHPKILLFLGEETALLLVGSGNLTTSGHGQNWELWTGFSATSKHDPGLNLVKMAVAYLRELTSGMEGISLQQIHDAITKCELLDGEVISVPAWQSFGNGERFSLIANGFGGTSILDFVSEKISDQRIVCIRVMAPYFDVYGGALEALGKLFPSAAIEVVLDKDSGAPPIEIANPLRIQFFHFKDAFRDNRDGQLHAKVMEFIGESQVWTLVGSQNGSLAALGSSERQWANEEAGIISLQTTSLLEQLGYVRPAVALRLEDLKRHAPIPEPETPLHTKFLVEISGLELQGFSLKARYHCNGKFTGLRIELFSHQSIETLELPLPSSGEDVVLPDNCVPSQFSFGWVQDESGSAISLRFPIHHLDALWRNQPSPTNRVFGAFYRSLSQFELPVFPIIEFWGKHLSKPPFTQKGKTIDPDAEVDADKLEQEQDAPSEPRSLSYSEFHALLVHADTSFSAKLQKRHSSGEFLELLRRYLREVIQAHDDILGAEDEDPSDDASQARKRSAGSTSPTGEKPIAFSEYQRLQAKLFNHLRDYAAQLEPLIANRAPLTLVDLQVANFNLTTVLLLRKYEVKLKKSVNIKEIVGMGEVEWIPEYGSLSELNNFRSLVLVLAGRFLMFAAASGTKGYATDPAISLRFKQEQRALVRTVLLAICLVGQIPAETTPKMGLWLKHLYFNLRRQFTMGEDFDAFEELGRLRDFPLPADYDVVSARRLLVSMEEAYRIDGPQLRTMYEEGRITYFEDLGYCWIAKRAPIDGSGPKTVRFGHCGFGFDDHESDFVGKQWFVIADGRFLRGLQRI